MSELPQALQALEAQSTNDFRRQALVKLLIPNIEGQMVLDVGCGMGFMTEQIVKIGKVAVALDTEFPYVAYATHRTKTYLKPASGVNYGGTVFPFSDGSFATILAFDVIEHVEDDVFFVKELRRVLANDGVLIIVVPALQSLYGKRDKSLGHFRRYNREEITRVLSESNLQIQYLNYWNLLGLFPYAFSERFLHREISDRIRTGKFSYIQRILVKFITKWLIFEGKLCLPVGLSLISISRKATRL
jgi:SAM-dependent methyltransferase